MVFIMRAFQTVIVQGTKLPLLAGCCLLLVWAEMIQCLTVY